MVDGSFVEDPEMDAIIQAYNVETNLERSKELDHQALRMIRDKHFGVAVVSIDGPYATSTAITEWDLGKRAYDQNLEYLFTR